MAATSTQLSGGITAGQTQIVVASGTGISVGTILRVGDEKMEVQNVANSPTLGVRRGINGTAALAHDTLAFVGIGAASDYPPPTFLKQRTYGQDGAITVEHSDDLITKAAAAALTLENPSKALNGLRKRIASATAAAHVITGVTIWDGTATVNVTITFPAIIGAAVELEAQNGMWLVSNFNAVTIAP